jgi:ribosomal-protein-alanine N-acetyltransferase
MIESKLIPFPDLTSQRLRLRELESQDQQEIFSLRSDERVNRYLDREPAHSVQDAINFIDRINNGIEKNENVYWAICLKENPRLIGTICLYNISIKSQQAELGYELNPFYHGKGIMHEAIDTVIKFGFDSLNLKSILAVPAKENINSIRLLERMGFTPDESIKPELSLRNDLEFVPYVLHKP